MGPFSCGAPIARCPRLLLGVNYNPSPLGGPFPLTTPSSSWFTGSHYRKIGFAHCFLFPPKGTLTLPPLVQATIASRSPQWSLLVTKASQLEERTVSSNVKTGLSVRRSSCYFPTSFLSFAPPALQNKPFCLLLLSNRVTRPPPLFVSSFPATDPLFFFFFFPKALRGLLIFPTLDRLPLPCRLPGTCGFRLIPLGIFETPPPLPWWMGLSWTFCRWFSLLLFPLY